MKVFRTLVVLDGWLWWDPSKRSAPGLCFPSLLLCTANGINGYLPGTRDFPGTSNGVLSPATPDSLVLSEGVLSGEKQSIGRHYNFPDAVSWFAER